MCDLNNSFSFRNFALNTVSKTTSGLSGCQIESIDHSEVEIRQFTEPLALKNGIDVGGVWLGGRHVRITGTIYGTSRSAAFASLASLEAVMLPEEGTFGYYDFPFTDTDGSRLILEMGIDITERKKAEAALRELNTNGPNPTSSVYGLSA